VRGQAIQAVAHARHAAWQCAAGRTYLHALDALLLSHLDGVRLEYLRALLQLLRLRLDLLRRVYVLHRQSDVLLHHRLHFVHLVHHRVHLRHVVQVGVLLAQARQHGAEADVEPLRLGLQQPLLDLLLRDPVALERSAQRRQALAHVAQRVVLGRQHREAPLAARQPGEHLRVPGGREVVEHPVRGLLLAAAAVLQQQVDQRGLAAAQRQLAAVRARLDEPLLHRLIPLGEVDPEVRAQHQPADPGLFGVGDVEAVADVGLPELRGQGRGRRGRRSGRS
jgi:hypothetical protein